MTDSPDERLAVQQATALEQPLQAVEDNLAALGQALHHRDAAEVDRLAAALHTSLAAAVDHFSRAAKRGGVPQGLRRRLATASGQVAAQREALARATASLDRAIDVLMPDHAAAPAVLYSAAGGADRAALPQTGLLA